MRKLTMTALLLLSACASADTINAPSLLPRPIESRRDAEPVSSVQTVAPDAGLDSRIAEQVAKFEAAARAFTAARPAVAAKVARARGAAEGSDRWLDGQSAIGELQQARTATDAAMADLESLAIDRGTAGALPYPALDAAIAAAQAELDRQLEAERAIKAVIGA